MGTFNPAQFLSGTTQEAGSTKFDPVPQGDYNAQIEKIDFREVETKNGMSIAADIFWNIFDPNVEAALGRKPQVKQGFFIDQDTSGGLDMSKGKNIKLNRVREAVGQNVPGQPWSPEMMVGQIAQIHVTVTPAKDDPETKYNNVTKVGRAA